MNGWKDSLGNFDPNALMYQLPFLLIVGFGLFVLVLEAFSKGTSKRWLMWVAVAGIVAAFIGAYLAWKKLGVMVPGDAQVVLDIARGAAPPSTDIPYRELFDGMLIFDRFGVFMNVVCLVGALLTVLLVADYMKEHGFEFGEVFALILFATAGMMLLAAANDLITVFLGLETMSLAVYVLTGSWRRSPKSAEAAMKYFLMGAFATGLLLYGIALIYGVTGATNLHKIAIEAPKVGSNPLFLIGVADDTLVPAEETLSLHATAGEPKTLYMFPPIGHPAIYYGAGAFATTLAATGVCTAAAAGAAVHVVTVNDYLAERDAEDNIPLYAFFGLTVGVVKQDMAVDERREQYAKAVVYVSNKELTFDYLKDRIALGGKLAAQLKLRSLQRARLAPTSILRGLHVAIVDEADSVLIDEARTPLIISETLPDDLGQEVYHEAIALAARLEPQTHYVLGGDRDIWLSPVGEAVLSDRAEEMEGVWKSPLWRRELINKALSVTPHLPARPPLHHCREQSSDRGRIHWSRHAGPNLGTRIAPDDRGEGSLRNYRTAADLVADHLSALLWALFMAGRHDGNGERSGAGSDPPSSPVTPCRPRS